jgi:hypothetical protein
MAYVAGFATIMMLAMSIEGTNIVFTLIFCVHVLLSALAFNAAGGFSRVIGAYVFFYSLFTLIFGVTWKTILGQPADSRLGGPLLDVTLYTVSMALLLACVYVMRALDYRNISIAEKLQAGDINYSSVGLGCLVTALLIQFLDIAVGSAPGSLLSIANQLNVFLPLGILMSTIGAIKNSNGRSSVDMISGASLVLNLIMGTLAFSKQGMLEPLVCWLAGATYMRYRLTLINYIAFVPLLYFAFFLTGTLSTLRNDVTQNGSYDARLTILINGVTHWDELKQRNRDAEVFRIEHTEGSTYFGTEQGGLIERLTMIPIDDTLFNFSAAGHYIGYQTILWDFGNWVPHFIWPDKHSGYQGNYYVHEMGGGLAEDDYTTGISFSPLAEAFHVDGWTGVIFLLPALWLMFFVATDLVVGDMHKSPWGLLPMILLAHAAPESLLSGLIQGIGYGTLSIAFAMFFSIKLAPIIGSVLATKQIPAGPQRILSAHPRNA